MVIVSFQTCQNGRTGVSPPSDNPYLSEIYKDGYKCEIQALSSCIADFVATGPQVVSQPELTVMTSYSFLRASNNSLKPNGSKHDLWNINDCYKDQPKQQEPSL